MPEQYKLFQIKDDKAHAVAGMEAHGKRLIILGGLYDLCTNHINKGSWITFNRILPYHVIKDVSVYTVAPPEVPAWRENDWIKKGIVDGEIAPMAKELAEQIFGLPKPEETLPDKSAYLKQLDYIAANTVFATFSTGGLLVQHVRRYLNEQLVARGFTEEELRPVLEKVGAVNVAPIYQIEASGKPDFTHISFINTDDINTAEAPKAGALWPEVSALARDIEQEQGATVPNAQFINLAYETRLRKLVEQGAQINNPNLVGAKPEILGKLRHGHNHLLVYGQSVPDAFPARAIHSFSKAGHSVTEQRPDHALRTHDIELYLYNASSTVPEKKPRFSVVQTYQRFAGAHLIPAAIQTLLGEDRNLDHFEQRIDESERSHVGAVLREQIGPDTAMLSGRTSQ